MPYKHKKFKIKKKDDRRRKLSETDKELIREQYKIVKSQRKLARIWNVSRRLIQFILDPKKKERDLELRKLRGGSKIYYDKEKHNKAMKKHRRYKQKLYLKKKLKGQDG